MKKIVFLIVGESSVGKDSLINLLCIKKKMKKLLSYTTRPRRKNEEDTHIFINKEDIEKYRNDMIAFTTINNVEYFATRNQLLESDFYIIDPNGIESLKELLKDDDSFRFVTIYVTTSFKNRYERVLQRGDKESVFLARAADEEKQFTEFNKQNKYDHKIFNDEYGFGFTYAVLEKIIDKEIGAED